MTSDQFNLRIRRLFEKCRRSAEARVQLLEEENLVYVKRHVIAAHTRQRPTRKTELDIQRQISKLKMQLRGYSMPFNKRKNARAA